MSGQDAALSDQQRQEAEAAALAAQRQQESLEHAQQRAQLEEATLPLMLDAMWAANVLDIESTLRKACKKVCRCQYWEMPIHPPSVRPEAVSCSVRAVLEGVTHLICYILLASYGE